MNSIPFEENPHLKGQPKSVELFQLDETPDEQQVNTGKGQPTGCPFLCKEGAIACAKQSSSGAGG